tara:strand:- start:884 stop:1579 length:696 start_codon:yes stop_codon:yes gene_type:complete
MNNYIEIRNITKNYYKNKKINVLKKINFKFKKGKIYSLVGPSGSGKSTFLNLISLIDKPSSGKIIIEKKEINYNDSSSNDKFRSKNIGIIYQGKNLLGEFNALENVYISRLAFNNNKIEAVDKAKKLLKKLNLSNRLYNYPSELSGGEEQRISLARALINAPNIILADEPTGNLDHKNSKEVFKILFGLKKSNRVIIFATHNRYFANMADCKIELLNGRINAKNARVSKNI